MRTTLWQFADKHQLERRLVNLINYYLESRGVTVAYYTDHEWEQTIERALNWWDEAISGAFSEWA